MARHSIHNRRAGRGRTGGGASWISYSDMMAALLLMFVLILCVSLYQYFTMLEEKTTELENQRLILVAQQADLDTKTSELLVKTTELEKNKAAIIVIQGELESQKIALETKQTELDAANAALLIKQTEAAALQEVLNSKQAALDKATEKLESQQKALNEQTQRLDDLVGVRSNIIKNLREALSSSNMKATVDPKTGDIVLESTVFFESGKSVIKEEGRQLLESFIPVYLNVLLKPEYRDYLGEIIIEGHTDSSGSYQTNLKLSQDRALQVAMYCLNMDSLTREQKDLLRKIMTAKGRSYSDLIYDANGNEDPDASRRVEFKFSLKDSDMIDEMNRILQGTEQ